METKVITLANSKGGSGKTTLAINLAAHLIRLGHTVTLLDADIQRSASEWIEKTSDPNLLKVNQCRATTYQEIKQTVENTESEILIIDSQGALTEELAICLAAADLVIVPCRPSRDDTTGTVRIIKYLKKIQEKYELEQQNAFIVMNGVKPRTAVQLHTYKMLVEAGYVVLKQQISDRVSIPESNHNCASVYSHSDPQSKTEFNILGKIIEKKIMASSEHLEKAVG